jgi:tRNA dimethylallyltransferase
MSIGTAVPPKEELSRVTHHFIQNRSIHEDYSVGDFEKDALQKINHLFKSHPVLVMVGGSGLYIDAVLKGLDYFPDIDPKIRKELNETLQKDGLLNLQAQLEYLDPKTYQSIDLQNPHRVIRALEVCLGSEKPFSYYKNQPKEPRNFIPIKIGLDADRKIIYNRIEQRVDIMLQEGLLDEAKSLYANKELNALQTVGYQELFRHFDGEYDLDFAIS